MSSIAESLSGIDRISNLPNSLITHILSFLSTEDAVRTSALSTHWNQQWTSLTVLLFDESVLFADDSGVQLNPNLKSMTSFVNFVYRVLLSKVTRLDYFKLQCGRDYGATNVSQWLSAALSRDVCVIVLDVPMHAGYLNNDQLFSSRTLVALTLGIGFFLKVPEMVSLGSLKNLHLGYLQFLDGESISRLVSGCLVLEELKIEGKLGERVRSLNISSQSLKRLILKELYSDQFSEINGASSYEIALDTPNLQYFEQHDDGLTDRFYTETLHCLDKVSLWLRKSGYQFHDSDLILARSMADFVIAISNVRFLDISSETYEEVIVSDSHRNIDRISNLPNNLITHILSFLSTEDAVRTSALSTHWNQHWTSVTQLAFNDGVLFTDDSGVKRNPNPRSKTSFVSFVYRVLLCKVTRLNYFSLQCGQDYGATNVSQWLSAALYVSQWLSAALSRNVRMMDIVVPMHHGYLNNEHLFSSRTLVVLTLGVGFFLKVPEIISLESLNILHLGYLQFVDGESISRLVSGCIVLEELKIEGKLGESVHLLSISSPSLKRLILKGLYSDRFSEINGSNSYEIALDTPNLEYFEHVDDGLPDGFHTETLRCLDIVKLHLDQSGYQLMDYDSNLILAHSMADLVTAISNVRFLELFRTYEEAFYYLVGVLPNYELPVFPHLTHLEIGLISSDVELFTAFLQCSPNLAYLSFALGCSLSEEFYEPPRDVPFCMLHNLKVIEVCCLELEPGLSMMKYFLENALCLEELIIPEWEENNAEVIKEIITLPITSKSCKIVT